MKYVVQDRSEEGFWDERPKRHGTLQDAIAEASDDHQIQIVAIPTGKVVWRSN